MPDYKYLLFDADNTLFDFNEAERLSFIETCEKSGICCSDELYFKYSEINDSLWKKLEREEITLDKLKIERFRMLLMYLGHPDNEKNTEKAAEMRDIYMNCLAQKAILMPEAAETCAFLSEKYEMYIITNGIGTIQRSRFSKSEIYKYFRDIFISEELGFAKPKTEYFDKVTEKIGDPNKARYLVIGDSLTSDCDGAIASGIDICRYNPKNQASNGRKLTYNIKKLSELKAVLL